MFSSSGIIIQTITPCMKQLTPPRSPAWLLPPAAASTKQPYLAHADVRLPVYVG
jgi:hypothetical protein